MNDEKSTGGIILYEDANRLVVRLDEDYATTLHDVVLTIERYPHTTTREVTCELVKRDTYGEQSHLRLPLQALERLGEAVARWKDDHASSSDGEVSDELGEVDDPPF